MQDTLEHFDEPPLGRAIDQRQLAFASVPLLEEAIAKFKVLVEAKLENSPVEDRQEFIRALEHDANIQINDTLPSEKRWIGSRVHFRNMLEAVINASEPRLMREMKSALHYRRHRSFQVLEAMRYEDLQPHMLN